MSFSPTALASAAARAAHTEVDPAPHLFEDPVAARLLADQPSPTPLDYQRAHPQVPVLASARATATLRTRLAAQVWRETGARQLVVLGAGLDTAAWTWADDADLVLEVDLPDSVAAKQAAVHAAGLSTGRWAQVATDLTDPAGLPAALSDAGLGHRSPVLVTALGLLMYLPPTAVRALLEVLPGLAARVDLVAEHMLPPEAQDAAGQEYTAAVGGSSGAAGEAWLSTAGADRMRHDLVDAGWSTVRTTTFEQVAPAGFWPASALPVPTASGLVHASTAPAGRAADDGR